MTLGEKEDTASAGRWREVVVVGVLVLVGLCFRLLFLAGWADTPLYHVPYGDEANFHQTALALIGQGEEASAFLYQPLYSFYLALVYTLFGVDIVLVRTLQLFVSVLTMLLAYGLGRELGGKWVGRLCALGLALYGPLVFFEGQLLAPGLVTPLLLGSFWTLLRAGKRQSLLWLLPAGLLLGLAIMGRPNLLILLPAGGLWWLWVGKGPRKKLLGAGLALLGIVVGLAPSWIHNALHGNPWSPVSTAGGISFFIGNNPQATGRFHVPRGMRIDDSSHEAYRLSLKAIAEKHRGAALSPAQVSSYWYEQGFRFWAADPGSAVALLGKKALLLVNSQEMAIHHPYYVGEHLVPVLRFLLRFGVVFAFAILGAFLTLREGRGSGLLLAGVAAVSLSLLAFYVADRYRISLLPMLMPLAALGIVEMARRVRQSGARKAWPAVLALALAFSVTQIPLRSEAAQRRGLAGSYNLMGKAEGDRGNLDKAKEYFNQALALSEAHRASTAKGNLGLLAEKQGRLQEARKWYDQAAQADGENRFVRYKLARLAERGGDLKEALRWLRELEKIEANPAPVRKAMEEIQARMQGE